MNLAVITPCLYPDTARIHYLIDSCAKHNVSLSFHGRGEVFGGWSAMLMRYTLPHMRSLAEQGYSHVLFVDAIDSLFVAGINEIAAKYERLCGDHSTLISGDSDPTPRGVYIDPGPWKYLNGGGYITPIAPWVCMIENLHELYPEEGNYQVWLEKHWPLPDSYVDYDCKIFQPMDGNPAVMPVGGRVLNALTGSWPCILHFRGGYCDPVTGRDERMKPWVEALTR